MTAKLLAHSDLLRAGIARSGACNRTLTPFSFEASDNQGTSPIQSERFYQVLKGQGATALYSTKELNGTASASGSARRSSLCSRVTSWKTSCL